MQSSGKKRIPSTKGRYSYGPGMRPTT